MCSNDGYTLRIGLSADQRRVLLDRQFQVDFLIISGRPGIFPDVRGRKSVLLNTELSSSHSKSCAKCEAPGRAIRGNVVGDWADCETLGVKRQVRQHPRFRAYLSRSSYIFRHINVEE